MSAFHPTGLTTPYLLTPLLCLKKYFRFIGCKKSAVVDDYLFR